MNEQNRPSDEMISRYLSGKATPEEEELVLGYMAENDENVDDLLNITAAVELQKKSEAKKKKNTLRQWQWVAAAAVAVVLMVVGVKYWPLDNGGVEQAPVYAAQDIMDSTDIVVEDEELNHI